MGYRPTLVKRYEIEYGATINGYNWKMEEFGDFLSKIGIEFCWQEDADYLEIPTSQLLDLNLSNLQLKQWEKENLINMIRTARECKYARNGYVRIEWI